MLSISKAKCYDIGLERILEMGIDFSSEKYSGGKGKTVVSYHGMCSIRLVGAENLKRKNFSHRSYNFNVRKMECIIIDDFGMGGMSNSLLHSTQD